MLERGILAALLLASNAPLPADYTECQLINNGPITPLTPKAPFQRQPDFAAMVSDVSETFPKTMLFDGMPPERMRGGATFTVSTGTVKDCGQAPKGTYFEACLRNNVVHMPNPCDFPTEKFAVLLCHEQAHKRWGWPKDHGA